MKIFRSKYTRETAALLKELMPEEFKDLPIVLNYGNGCTFDESKYPGKLILNRKEAVKRCSTKREMFKYIKEHSVGYIDIKTAEGVIKAVSRLLDGEELVGRKGRRIGIIKNIKDLINAHDQIDYITVKENKVKEYRVLMVLGEPFRIMEKKPIKQEFAWKQANSQFEGIPIRTFDKGVLSILKKVTKEIGIDVCGIDLLLDKKGKYKILEVNSGASLCKRSIKKFYKKLGKIIEQRNLLDTKHRTGQIKEIHCANCQSMKEHKIIGKFADRTNVYQCTGCDVIKDKSELLPPKRLNKDR